jgi:hypothetical protein
MKRHQLATLAAAIGLAWAGAAGASNPLPATPPGDQSNSNQSGDVFAGNWNGTKQSNAQAQTGTGGDATSGDATGGNGGGGDADSGKAVGGDVNQSQNASNSNETTQNANAESKAVQFAPSNVNISVRILSPGDGGNVTQSNSNESGDAYAKNGNQTVQSNTQQQAGTGGDARSGDAAGGDGGEGGHGGAADSGDAYGGDVDSSQNASNSNRTNQEATARSEAVQIAPNNTNLSVRILSDGDDGDVTQSNSNQSGDAFAGNWNGTEQSNAQSQSGTGGDASSGAATGGDGGDKGGCGCKSDGGGGGDADSGDAYGGDVDQSQNASNTNETTQNANASSEAVQKGPANVLVLFSKDGKKGDGCGCASPKSGGGGTVGDVAQSNSNRSGDAFAGNWNGTEQSNAQSQSGTGGNAVTGAATGGDGGSKGSSWKSGGKGGCGCGGNDGDGGDADSGDAYGGDVTQSQNASNSNETTQNAYAWSKAWQLWPRNEVRGNDEKEVIAR